MTYYSEHRDVIAHLQQLEVSSGFRGYDHFRSTPRGWRREREIAELKEHNPTNRKPSTNQTTIMQLLLNWFAWQDVKRADV